MVGGDSGPGPSRDTIFASCYCPVPERFTVCWLVNAESVNVRVPVVDPVTVGEKVTPTVQVPPPAMVPTQVLLDTANPALALTPENVRVPLKRFVKVTVFAVLVDPTRVEVKVMEEAEKVTGALPVPDRLTD